MVGSVEIKLGSQVKNGIESAVIISIIAHELYPTQMYGSRSRSNPLLNSGIRHPSLKPVETASTCSSPDLQSACAYVCSGEGT